MMVEQRSLRVFDTIYDHDLLTTLITHYVSDDRKFSNVEIHKMLKSELDKTEFEVPSLSFVTKKARMIQKNVEVFAKRHGKRAAKEKLPYQPLKVPERKNVQWQIDGWDLPFWMVGNGSKLERWVLVRVIDVCSRKILGWVTCEKNGWAKV